MATVEQMKREKIRAVVMATFELVFGVIVIYLGLQYYALYDVFTVLLAQLQNLPYSPYTPVAPAFIIDLFKTVRTMLLIGGILIVLHGMKRIVDNVLRAWARSATPKVSERDEARDRAIDSISPKDIFPA